VEEIMSKRKAWQDTALHVVNGETCGPLVVTDCDGPPKTDAEAACLHCAACGEAVTPTPYQIARTWWSQGAYEMLPILLDEGAATVRRAADLMEKLGASLVAPDRWEAEDRARDLRALAETLDDAAEDHP
jgi:hypothetical protein